MSLSPATKRHYVEVAHHTLHAVRTAGTVVEFCRECALEDLAGVQSIISAWCDGQSVAATVAINPAAVWWHLSRPEWCRSEADVRRLAAQLPHRFREPVEVIGCSATDGTPLSPEHRQPCVLGITPADLLAVTAGEAIERGIVTAALGSATLGCIGAVSTALAGEEGRIVWLWDIGPARSHLFTVSANGIEGVAACDVGFSSIFSAVQQVVGTERVAARRLFFGDDPAVRSAGARVAAELVPRLEPVMRSLAGRSAPVGFACLGLTHKQAWFGHVLARTLGVAFWVPEPRSSFARLGLSLATGNDVGLSTDVLGVLHAAAEDAHGSSAWHPNWGAVLRGGGPPRSGVHAAAGRSVGPTPPPVSPAAPAVLRETPPRHSKGEPTPPETPSTPQSASSPVNERSAAAAAPSLPPRIPPRSAASAANPVGMQVGADPRGASASTPALSGSPHSKPVPPAPSKSIVNGGSSPPVAPPPGRAAAAPSPEPVVVVVRKRGVGVFVGLVLALAGAGVGAKFYRDAQDAKARAAQQQQTIAEQRAAVMAERDAMQEQLRAAEQRAIEVTRAAAEEAEQMRKDAEAAADRAARDAEERIRRQMAAEFEAVRRANAPGALTIATSPAGAEVSVDGGPPQRTPARIERLAPGPHRLRITLPRHLPIEVEAAVEGGKATDLGTIKLELATGTATIASAPEGIDFSIRKTGTSAATEPGRRGRTPARLDDLPPGDYEVRFTRPGWPEQTERLSVVKGGTARVFTTFTGANVTITSNPEGATVHQAGAIVGTTPLTLSDIRPGPFEYELHLEGHEPLTVRGSAEAGRELRLEGKLLAADRVAGEVELRTPPRPLVTGPLRYGRGYLGMPKQVMVSFVVQRDGTLRDISLVDRVHPELAAQCIKAVSAWTFYPALSHAGDPVNARVTVPLRIARK